MKKQFSYEIVEFRWNMNVFVARLLNLYRIWIAFQNAIAMGSCRIGDDFLLASLTTCRRISGSKVAFLSFLNFSLGRCWKNEKNRILAGEVSQSVKIALPRGVGIKKKTTPMQHGSAKNGFCDTSRTRTSFSPNITSLEKFCCCRFWQVQKCVKWIVFLRIPFFGKFLTFFKNVEKWKCC